MPCALPPSSPAWPSWPAPLSGPGSAAVRWRRPSRCSPVAVLAAALALPRAPHRFSSPRRSPSASPRARARWRSAPRREAADPPIRRELSDAIGGGPVWLEGRLRDDATPGRSGSALTLDVERWEREGQATAASPALASPGVRLTVAGTLGLEHAGDWRAGRLVRLPALLRLPGRYQDPGVSDARLALARRGVALVGSVKSGALVEVRAPGWWGAEGAARVRRWARGAVRRHVGRYAAQSEADRHRDPDRRSRGPRRRRAAGAAGGRHLPRDGDLGREHRDPGRRAAVAAAAGGRRPPGAGLGRRSPCWSATRASSAAARRWCGPR